MGRKSACPEEFGKDAIALCRAVAGKRTYAAVAAELGVTAESPRTWVREGEAQRADRHEPWTSAVAGRRRRPPRPHPDEPVPDTISHVDGTGLRWWPR
ncbi:hypothetical protein ACIRFH_09890 [Streptomyces sp. NPDC093586]|uniref:hypothetical protein n=1 Tax=Streptomyces sp. NPDC093586 TaxID=3366042 RepID=UPI003807EFC9